MYLFQEGKMKLSLKKEGESLLMPLAGKPALVSAMVVMTVFAAFDYPEYAPILLFPVALATFVVSPTIQKTILCFLLIGVASHLIFTHQTIMQRELKAPQSSGCGFVEEVLPRPKGTAFIIQGPQQKVRLTYKGKNAGKLPLPGDSVCYEASFYPVLPPTVPGAFDTEGWLKSQGLAGYGKLIKFKIISSQWTPERSFYQFRRWIKSRFSEFLDPAETGLLLGLLAGDKSGISEMLRSDFQRSGLVHVLAISGFHVVLLAGMLMIMLKATGLPIRVARIVAIALLFLYVPVTGGSPAVRRAVLMFVVPQIGYLLERPASTLNSLGVALLFILLPEPSVLWNPGFQLSVAATAGILIGGKYNPFKNLPDFLTQSKVWNKFQGFVLEPTFVTLCATLATSPFLIHHFKTLSPFAWLGNIVVVPAISWGMQAGLFALMSPLNLILEHDFLREYFCYAARFFLRLAALLTRFLSNSSMASITVGPFEPIFLLAIGVLILLLPLLQANKIARMYGFTTLLLFSLVFLVQSYTQIKKPQWKLTVIDVGQGDSILLTTPSQRHFLIDAGENGYRDSGKDIIVPYLHHIGVLQLEALIITHPDADHFGGAKSLLQTFPVKELWISSCARVEEKKDWQNTITEALGRRVKIRQIHRGFAWSENYFQIQALHPNEQKCGETNFDSITLRAKGLGKSALLTGDLSLAGEKDITKTNIYLQSDVIKLGHHGSKTSSGTHFLQKTNPQIALISSGRKNRFKHPHKQVLQRLDSLKIPYLNTAEKGTIQLFFTQDSLWVETMM